MLRYLLPCALALLLAPLLPANPSRAAPLPAAEPIRIGVLSDMTGILANDMGPGSVIATQMAIDEVGGKIGDRPIELVTGDHQNKPDVGASIARQWFDSGVLAIFDTPNSAIALNVAAQARERNRVFATTGATTTELTGARCSPNTVHWPVDNYAIGHSLGEAVLARGGRKWFFITTDYAFGTDQEAQTSDAVRRGGGVVVGGVRTPMGTSDYSSYLIQAQQSGADVVMLAMVGDDVMNALKQAAEFGLTKTMTVAAPTMGQTEVRAVGLAPTQGLLAISNFLWNLNDDTKAFSARFLERDPRHWEPTKLQAGTYSVVRHYLRALQTGVDPADGRAVVAAMKAIKVQDQAFGTNWVRADGRFMNPVFLVQVNTPAQSTGPWDLMHVVGTIPAEQAYRPLAGGGCPLLAEMGAK
jgi:branched-chain amino acid transport system substrate-binding protein